MNLASDSLKHNEGSLPRLKLVSDKYMHRKDFSAFINEDSSALKSPSPQKITIIPELAKTPRSDLIANKLSLIEHNQSK
jgi:hypothetical protein